MAGGDGGGRKAPGAAGVGGRGGPRRREGGERSGPARRENGARRGAPGAPATAWERVAGWYDRLVGAEGSDHHREVILPGVVGLLKGAGVGPGGRVLDLACGQGVLCRHLAREGYRATGVDASPALLAAAVRRSRGAEPPIRYLEADVTRLVAADGRLRAGLDPEAFDAVTVVLAAQNLSPLAPVWAAARAALRPGGCLVAVLVHPCFHVPRHSAWHWDEASGTQARLVRTYLTDMTVDIEVRPGLAAHGRGSAAAPHFHRPLSAYVNTLGEAGLLVDRLEEWVSHKRSTSGARERALDRARREIPLFLALRARKLRPFRGAQLE